MKYERSTAFALGFVTVLMFTLSARPDPSMSLPDPTLTPGAILDTDPTVICTHGYARSHRVWRDKRGTATKYNIPWSTARDMEDDDLGPVGLGFDNSNPKNHWLQPCSEWRTIGTHGLRECAAGEAYLKDVQERHDEILVCRVLRIQGHAVATDVLHGLQQFYLTNGWAK